MKILIYRLLNFGCFTFLFLVLGLSGCKKFIDVSAPVTSTNSANIFTNDATAAAVLTGIYARISNANFTSGGITSMSLFPGLSADELTLYNFSAQINKTIIAYYTNTLTNLNTGGTDFWNNIYPVIFIANSAIEGLNNSKSLTIEVRQQLIGEAKFVRAFCYFYLVNLYGDLPLVISTDFEVNRLLSRTSKLQVYLQIIADLKDAQGLLSNEYMARDIMKIATERISPNKGTATALLARSYLYISDYLNAEIEATKVINNTSLYDTVPLTSNVFNANSKEIIWQLQPVIKGWNTWDARLFKLPATGPNVTGTYPVYLSNNLVNSFEIADKRKINWVGSISVGPTTYYYPYKYKSAKLNDPVTEYLVVLRLGEQYLIRSEARAQQNNISDAQSDLNTIRKRAGLANTTANDKTSLLTAIMHERQVEFFTEWGHRWFDLKRTNSVDAIMATTAVQKGGAWDPYKALYPIPQYELDKNPSLVGHQNLGY